MAYIAVSDLSELGYNISNASDQANLLNICETASCAVDAYCNQTFTPNVAVVEQHLVRVRYGKTKVFPFNLSVSNIESIVLIDNNWNTYTATKTLYLPVQAYVMADVIIGDGTYLANLTYDYGFATIPFNLKKAVILSAAPLLDDYFLSEDSNVSMVKSIKQGDIEITRSDTSDIPDIAKRILASGGYVRVRSG